MSSFGNAIGIDVSKQSLDVYDYQHGLSLQVSNCKKGYKQLLKWAIQRHSGLEQILFCWEHTGMYSLPVALFFSEQKLHFCMVPGLEIKRSMGMSRGKSDQKDAKTIARYAYLRREELKLHNLPAKVILELKNLLTLREKMVRDRTGYQTTLKEMKRMLKVSKEDLLCGAQEHIIKELSCQIKKLEQKMRSLIKEDEQLDRLFQLVTSVKGVGLILGINFIVYTNGFTAFANWRKFACYVGIAPFEHQSGTSIKGKKKVSHLANKKLKALLSNAACSCIKHCGEMRQYYQKRTGEGKSKMSTQNVIRNKIVARVFSVVKRGTPYIEDFHQAA